MIRILRRTALQAIPTMVGVVVVSFLMLHLMPGDAVDALAGISGGASAETVAAMRESYGLNDSLAVQFWRYAAGVFTLDFGQSISYGSPVFRVITERLPATLLLAFAAFGIALTLGIAAGWAMAVFADRWQDRVLSTATLFLYSAPSFWVGLMAIVVFAAKLNLFPLGGAETIGADLTGWAWFSDRARHLVLPSVALASFFVAIYARLTRAAMQEVLHQDFIRTARAKGLHPLRLQFRHGLRNALIPVITMAGLHLGNLVGGAVVVETVFNWPGIGRLTMGALASRDISVLLGILLMTSVVVIAMNILIDWIVTRLDPRALA